MIEIRRIINSCSNVYLSMIGLVVISFIALYLWSFITAQSLGIHTNIELFSIATIIKSGFIVPSILVALYIILPIVILALWRYGREYRLVSQYLLWNWAGSLTAASFALYCFSSWEVLPISLAPWNAIDLCYELHTATLLWNRWMTCLIGSMAPILIFNFIGRLNLNQKMRDALGNAHFATAFEIRQAELFEEEGIVIGKSHGKILRVPGFESVLLTASTGSGKTASIAIPNLIEHKGSAIINDLKGELYHLTAQYRADHDNNKCYFFNPMDENTQDFYNPFFYVSSNPKIRIDDLMIIAEALIQENKLGDGFWYQASRELFILLSLFLLETKGNATLAEIHDLSKKPDIHDYLVKQTVLSESAFTEALKERAENFAEHALPFTKEILAQTANSFSGTHEETRLSVLKDFHSRMTSMMSYSIREATSKNTFDLRQLRKEKMSIYIHIPPSRKKLLSPLLTIFWTQVTHLLTQREPDIKKEPHAVLCLLDEFGMIAKIDSIRESLSFLRSYRIRFLIIVQYLNQIISTYGQEDADSFFNNTKTKIYFTATDYKDAERVSKSLGVKATVVTSKSINEGGFQSNGHVTHSQNNQSLPLMRPDEIMRLNKKLAIILVAGHPPIKATKLYWFKQYNYKKKLGA